MKQDKPDNDSAEDRRGPEKPDGDQAADATTSITLPAATVHRDAYSPQTKADK